MNTCDGGGGYAGRFTTIEAFNYNLSHEYEFPHITTGPARCFIDYDLRLEKTRILLLGTNGDIREYANTEKKVF